MTKYADIAKELGIDPDQGIEQTLAEAGELIIAGRLVQAEAAPPAPERPKAKSPTAKEGE